MPNNISLKWFVVEVCGRSSFRQVTQFTRCIFLEHIYIFRHLKLEIALAIPASYDEKYFWNNSAGQGLDDLSVNSQSIVMKLQALLSSVAVTTLY